MGGRRGHAPARRRPSPGQRGGAAMSSATATLQARSRLAEPPLALLLAGLAVLVVALFGVSLAVGRAPLSLGQALDDVLHGRTTLASLVLTEVRLPRALLG